MEIHENQNYKTIALTFTIPVVGVLSGWLAHIKFNPLFVTSEANDNWILPARYSVGYTSIAPVYMLVCLLQNRQHSDYIPLWRRLTDFIISGFLVGCGVMLGRLFGR